MNSVIIYNPLVVRGSAGLSGPLDRLKNLVQDAGKTAVNAVTRPALMVTGQGPIYETSDFSTRIGQTGSKIQAATTAAGATIIGSRLGVNVSPNQNINQPMPGSNMPDNLTASGPSFSNQKIALVAGGVLLFGALAYFATKN